MRKGIYVGLTRMSDTRQVFRSFDEPTFENTQGRYAAVIGPFKTMRAAVWATHQINNPHFQTVADAERLSR
jgi:hypothetical protein